MRLKQPSLAVALFGFTMIFSAALSLSASEIDPLLNSFPIPGFEVKDEKLVSKNPNEIPFRITLPENSVLLNVKSKASSESATLSKNPSGDYWRVIHISEPKDDKSIWTASATTYYDWGLRARTECEATLDQPINCITATQRLCSSFIKKIRAPNYSNLDLKGKGPTQLADQCSELSSMSTRDSRTPDLTQKCLDLSSALLSTLDPMTSLSDQHRGVRDDEVVVPDVKAIRDVYLKLKQKQSAVDKRDLRSLTDSERPLGAKIEDRLGASTTGMRNRTEALEEALVDLKEGKPAKKKAMADLKRLARLGELCLDQTVVFADFERDRSPPKAKPVAR